MKLKNYYHEIPTPFVKSLRKKYDNPDHKIAVWNAFAESGLDGVNDDDFSILPRLIPESYMPEIEKTCKEVTKFLLQVLSLPEQEIKAIVPHGPVRDFLIDELKVLKHNPKRLTGSFRFDMAIVGKPVVGNSPKLLEVNEIGFDGLARSTFFQNTLMDLIPELKTRAYALDTARAEIKNMLRLGPDIARIQYDCYNWDEEILQTVGAGMGARLHLVSPSQFKSKLNMKHFPKMLRESFDFHNNRVHFGKLFKPDALNMSFAFTLSDLKRDRDLYAKLVASETPQYGPFVTSLVASKTILILLSDMSLRRKLLGSSESLKNCILPAFSLDGQIEHVKKNADELVIKHTDGCGGEQVFMVPELLKYLPKIPKNRYHEWVVQQKTELNTIDVNGILSRRKKTISDLGVFVHYDWQDGKFLNFEVGGLMTRATNKGLKVNVSSGGLQVAVMVEKGI